MLEERYAGNVSAAQKENPAAAVRYHYIWDIRYIDAAVCRDSGSTYNSSRIYYLQDANFNTTALVNVQGQVIERYVYDAYGQVAILNGNADPYAADWSLRAGQQSAVGNELLYAGYRYDASAGLYHVRHRAYHPTIGRWLQRDPIGYGDGMGLCGYYGGPSSTDPSGCAIVVNDGEPTPIERMMTEESKRTDWQRLTQFIIDRSAAPADTLDTRGTGWIWTCSADPAPDIDILDAFFDQALRGIMWPPYLPVYPDSFCGGSSSLREALECKSPSFGIWETSLLTDTLYSRLTQDSRHTQDYGSMPPSDAARIMILRNNGVLGHSVVVIHLDNEVYMIDPRDTAFFSRMGPARNYNRCIRDEFISRATAIATIAEWRALHGQKLTNVTPFYDCMGHCDKYFGRALYRDGQYEYATCLAIAFPVNWLAHFFLGEPYTGE